MCGYIGKVSFSEIAEKELESANNYIVCRGPDSKKKSTNLEDTFKHSLIFNRLSILDLKENADQPMFSNDNERILMFNGEIYNHIELRKTMEKRIAFNTDHSDSEVILNGISLFGIDFINKLRGQFSIFFWDKKKRKIYLVRDRLGQKPLYFKHTKDSLTFGSNLKSIASAEKDFELNLMSVSEYLDYGAIASPNTIFKNYNKVKPAEIIEFDYSKKQIEKKSKIYWDPENFIDNKQFEKEEFFNIFSESIDIRTKADVPVANFLSGGIDSSSIVKNLYDNNNSVNTFSIKVDNKKYDEGPWAELVAKKYITNHQSVKISSKIGFDDIKGSMNSLDEPYADPSVVPSYLLSREISKYYKVAISGDGGDELLGGYDRTSMSLKDVSKINSISYIYNLYPAFAGTGNYFLSKSKNLHTRYSSFLEDKNLLKLINLDKSKSPKNIYINNEIEPYKSLLIADYKFYLSEMMLFKIDRTSMANSLEIRSPFVDHNLVEYVLSHESNYYSINTSKKILKDYLSEDFDSNFINRKKQGFVFDIENWVFKNFNDISDSIYSGSISELIPKNALRSLSIIKSRINSHRIWKIYILDNYLSNLS